MKADQGEHDELCGEMLDVKMKAVQWRLGRVKSREAALSTVEMTSDATRDGMSPYTSLYLATLATSQQRWPLMLLAMV